MKLKSSSIALSILLMAVQTAWSQGVFFASTQSARTRLGSLEGAFATTNIYGLFLGGAVPGSLVPIGIAQPHFANGAFGLGNIPIPGVPAYDTAFVQFIAWDVLLWGADWTAVPGDQLGRTDIVPVFLTTGVFPDVTFVPRFTQPAIVPVPEPSAWALLALGGGAAILLARPKRRE